MKKLCYVLPALLIFVTLNTFAAKVDIETARKVGVNYLYERLSQVQDVKFTDIAITGSFTEYIGTTPVYYTFNTNPAGFIIVSADDACYPVIGYSLERNLDFENQPTEFEWWMQQMAKQVTYAGEHALNADAEIKSLWSFYATADVAQLSSMKSKVVTPLLPSNWDQGKYYNQLCPTANDGPDGHALVGCVATSMAQVMYYYRYPVNGLGTHALINLSNVYYRWNEMVNEPTNYNFGIAELCFHAGKTVNMNYSGTGSGAQTEDVPAAMKSHFRYNAAISYKNKVMYNSTNWAALLRNNLDAKHPLIYSGSDPNEGGHAWVCDGYQGTDQFHMNWGWGGNANGYFTTANLAVGGYNFSDWQGAVVDIYPGTGYPANCSGTLNTITYSNGTVEDGSGINNYQNNNDCRWLIAPAEPVSHINFTFVRFETEGSNDVLTIYDGDNISAPVLGTFSGSSLPTYVTSSGDKMLLRFTTNGSTTGSGWLGEFHCTFPQFCSSVTTLTAPSGSFDDGSGANNYSYNQTCRWVINPPNTASISLSFSDFNIANDDYIKVYDQIANLEVANYTGTTIPSTQVYNSSKIMVLLKTNSYTNAPGFSCSYNSTALGIGENAISGSLEIYPNPSTASLNVNFISVSNTDASIEIITITGEKVYSMMQQANSGTFRSVIDVSGFAKGVYFLRIGTNDESVIRKVVIM